MIIPRGDGSYLLRVRLAGAQEQVLLFLDHMRTLPHVNRVVEIGADARHLRDDSSSAGLAEAGADMDFHNVEIGAQTEEAASRAQDLAEVAARELNLVIEYMTEF